MHSTCKIVQTGRYLLKAVRGKSEDSSIPHLVVSLVRVHAFTAVQPHVDSGGFMAVRKTFAMRTRTLLHSNDGTNLVHMAVSG